MSRLSEVGSVSHFQVRNINIEKLQTPIFKILLRRGCSYVILRRFWLSSKAMFLICIVRFSISRTTQQWFIPSIQFNLLHPSRENMWAVSSSGANSCPKLRNRTIINNQAHIFRANTRGLLHQESETEPLESCFSQSIRIQEKFSQSIKALPSQYFLLDFGWVWQYWIWEWWAGSSS